MSGSLNSSFDMSRARSSKLCVRRPASSAARPDGFGDPLRTDAGHARTTFKIAGRMRCESGKYSISSVYGNGVSKPVTRTGAASR